MIVDLAAIKRVIVNVLRCGLDPRMYRVADRNGSSAAYSGQISNDTGSDRAVSVSYDSTQHLFLRMLG